MIKLRRTQLNALEQAGVQKFRRQLSLHVLRFFPERCIALGRDGVQEWIDYGMARSPSCGATTEREIFKYVGLLFALGRDFDVDPGQIWGDFLRERKNSTFESRVDQIFAAVIADETHLVLT